MNTPINIEEAVVGLRMFGACGPGAEWLSTQPDPHTAWQACDNPTQLLWVLQQGDFPRHTYVEIVRDCFEPVRPLFHDARSAAVVDVLHRWLEERTTQAEVAEVTDAAWAAARTATPNTPAELVAEAAARAVAVLTEQAVVETATKVLELATQAATSVPTIPPMMQWTQCNIIRQHVAFESVVMRLVLRAVREHSK